MKKAVFLYNPASGDGRITAYLDTVIKMYQSYGTDLTLIRLDENMDLARKFSKMNDTDHLIISGGDGTVNVCINEMLKAGKNIPFGIIPSGTANDFSSYIGMPPGNVAEAVRQINVLPPQQIDLPMVNGSAFINVLSAGFFTDISQKTDIELKNSIGKLAYYLKSIEMIKDLNPTSVKIETDDGTFIGDIFLLMVFNGVSAGSIRIMGDSRANDGLLDVLVIKAGTIKDLVPPALGIIRGANLEKFGENVIIIKSNKIRIFGDCSIPTDMDGEKGPSLPLEIECKKGALTVLGVSSSL